MNDYGRAGLLLLAMLCSLGVVPVLLRSLRPLILLALHGVGMSVAFGAAVSALTGASTGPALALPFAVMIALVGLEHDGAPAPKSRFRLFAVILSVGGLLLALAAQLWTGLGQATSLAAGVLGAAFLTPAAITLLRRARSRGSPALARADRASAAAAIAAAVGLLLAAAESVVPGVWPVVLGASAAVVSSVRSAPHVPPTAREWVTVLLLGLASFLSLGVVLGPRAGALGAAPVAALAIGLIALSRPTLAAGRVVLRPPHSAAERRLDRVVPLRSNAIGVLAPMVDDGALRRPLRPSVLSRVPARRLLDAALERARSRQIGLDRQDLRVEVRSDDGEVDVDCDAADVAEALCSVLDNALRLRADHPALHIRVHLRGGHRQVTFEVSDDLARHLDGPGEGAEASRPALEAPHPPTASGDDGAAIAAMAPDAEHPFFSADLRRGARPGLGLGLARARVLLERQGGFLLTRRTEEGSCVQLTLPRRKDRPSSANA